MFIRSLAAAEPFSETDARSQVLRLREYLATGSDAQDPAALGVSPGASMYEAIRDGLVPAIEEKKGQSSRSRSRLVGLRRFHLVDFADSNCLFARFQS